MPAYSQQASKEVKRPADLLGDILPPGAIARMGVSRTPSKGYIRSLVYSRDGRRLISTSIADVRLWDARSGKLLQDFGGFSPEGLRLDSFAISPDQTQFAASVEAGIEIWDMAKNKKVRSWKKPARSFLPIAYSSSGKMLAAKDRDGVVFIWNAGTGKEIRRFKTFSTQAGALSFSPDDRSIAFWETDRAVHVCAIDTGARLPEFHSDEKIGVLSFFYALKFSPDGKFLAGVTLKASEDSDRDPPWSRGSAVLWDVARGTKLDWLSDAARASTEFVFSQDSHKLVLGGNDGDIYVWDLLQKRQTGHFATDASPILAMALSPNGKTLATAGQGVAIRQWDLATGKEVRGTIDSHRDQVAAAAFSPDGRMLATIGNDRTLRLWDAHTGRQLHRIMGVTVLHEPPKMVTVLRFAPDGRSLIVNCGDSTIRFWDTQTARLLRSIDPPPRRVRTCMCLSSDGSRLAVYEKNYPAQHLGSDPRIVLYDVRTGRQLSSVPGPSASVFHLAFAKDDTLFVAATFDEFTKRIRAFVLDSETGDELRHFDFRTDCSNPEIAFAPDAGWAAVQFRMGPAIRLYDLVSGDEMRSTESLWKPLHSLTSSSDGRVLTGISEDKGRIYCWEIATAKKRCVFEGHGGGRTVCFSPDSTLLASAGEDTSALVWEIPGYITTKKKSLAAEELASRWSDLVGEDAGRAATAIWTLADFPQQTVPFLSEHLRPIPAIDPQELSRSITDLESNSPAIRKQAASKLEQAGETAAPALREALKSTRSPAVRRQIGLLLEEVDPVAFVTTNEKLRVNRALEILEHIGTPLARAALATLASGAPGAAQTQEAQAAIKRLGVRSLASDRPAPAKQ
jgi:WD40 repeat protein